jgi:Amt family ammonium transporter
MRKRLLMLAVFMTSCIIPLFAVDQPEIDTGVTAWMLTSTALVLLMIPGLAMFYGGLVRSKNVLGTMMHSFAAMGVMSVLWVAVSYSMTFGQNILGGWIGWNPDCYRLCAGTYLRVVVDCPENYRS